MKKPPDPSFMVLPAPTTPPPTPRFAFNASPPLLCSARSLLLWLAYAPHPLPHHFDCRYSDFQPDPVPCRDYCSRSTQNYPSHPFMEDKTTTSVTNRVHDEEIWSQKTPLPSSVCLNWATQPLLFTLKWKLHRDLSLSFWPRCSIKSHHSCRPSEQIWSKHDYCQTAIYERHLLFWVDDSSGRQTWIPSPSETGDIVLFMNFFFVKCFTWPDLMPFKFFMMIVLFIIRFRVECCSWPGMMPIKFFMMMIILPGCMNRSLMKVMYVCGFANGRSSMIILSGYMNRTLMQVMYVCGFANGRCSINSDLRFTHPQPTCTHISISIPHFLMSNLSPKSTLSLPNSPDGCADCQDHVSSPDNTTQSRGLPVLDGVRYHPHSHPDPPRSSDYANALKYGLGCNSNTQVPSPVPDSSSKLPRSKPTGPHSLDQSDPDSVTTHSPPPRIHMEELLNCCLLGKIWGEPLPLPAIIHKTKKDWHFIKGQVEYIDAGNDWVMIRFANVTDRMLVYDQRPWHVNGLNFVLHKWTPFFDPYFTSITRIDQWVRIPRLPWEFWDKDSLADLLNHVGPIINIDQNTLLRLKGSNSILLGVWNLIGHSTTQHIHILHIKLYAVRLRGGCWIVSKQHKSSVAPLDGEQPNYVSLRYSPPPNFMSMMILLMSETHPTAPPCAPQYIFFYPPPSSLLPFSVMFS